MAKVNRVESLLLSLKGFMLSEVENQDKQRIVNEILNELYFENNGVNFDCKVNKKDDE
jgi:hypothetical protein